MLANNASHQEKGETAVESVLESAISNSTEKLVQYKNEVKLASSKLREVKRNFYVVVRESGSIQLLGRVKGAVVTYFSPDHEKFQPLLKEAAASRDTVIRTVGPEVTRQDFVYGKSPLYLPTQIDPCELRSVVRDISGYL